MEVVTYRRGPNEPGAADPTPRLRTRVLLFRPSQLVPMWLERG